MKIAIEEGTIPGVGDEEAQMAIDGSRLSPSGDIHLAVMDLVRMVRSDQVYDRCTTTDGRRSRLRELVGQVAEFHGVEGGDLSAVTARMLDR
jgi:hypothetical protein